MKTSILFLAVFIAVVSSLEFDHPCRDDVPAKDNFLPFPYSGIWFELQRSDDQGADCLTHHYTIAINQTFDVVRDGLLGDEWLRELGTATIAFPGEREEDPFDARFNATILRVGADEPIEYTYQVYKSDYTNYAITWMCENLPGGRSREEGAVMSRTTQLSPSTDRLVTFLLEEIGFNRDDFRTIDQSFERCILGAPPERKGSRLVPGMKERLAARMNKV